MNLVCPVCSSKFTMAQATKESLHLEIVRLASKFGHNWDLVNEYVDCFRQDQYSSVSMKKRIRILKELLKLFESKAFTYQRRSYRVTVLTIMDAMNLVLNMDKFGFKNHNYLKSVMTDRGAERVSSEGLTAEEEAGSTQQGGRSLNPLAEKEKRMTEVR